MARFSMPSSSTSIRTARHLSPRLPTAPLPAITSRLFQMPLSLSSRSPKYTTLTTSHVSHIRKLVSSPSSVLSTLDGSATPDELLPHNLDWMGKYLGQSQVLVKPKTVKEVSQIVKWCNENDVAVVPQGGNTGLVGGSTPIHDELILSLSSLNSIRSFDPVSGVLTAEAGLILEQADSFLASKGFVFPLDLGAKGSCQIGGNVATNAGGLRLLRYGSLRGSVLGLEVVLPDGRIWDGLSGLRKNNTGYDLKQLFIGSEGSIGIITAISILCPSRSLSTNVALFSLPSYAACLEVFSQAKQHLGEIMSAFEMFDNTAYEAVKKQGGAKKVFEKEGNFYCLIETGGSSAEHDSEKLTSLFDTLLSSSLILDGVLAQDNAQVQSLWQIRELCPESLSKAGTAYKYDLSVPVEKMYEVVERMRAHLKERGLLGGKVKYVAGFGHMGDGNLHLNVVAEGNVFSKEIQGAIEPFVYELVGTHYCDTTEQKSDYNGSISAEHGLGSMKAPFISYSQADTSIDLMRRLKKLFDPKGIMNPHKFIL
ncbi:D-lactate dehydrogenase [Cryptococcus deuterogattii 99/473]|uniref:D-lactate dehydrogenase n=1 Tax=Cryptococcus deuterogattii Ram5 TaxID=1296110 RepID=A0A0D0UV74_9TREE|nr:D-lactate dehydrogenase [Cryptococcus deuterogattii Ram5]KIY55574.1 D-lactate dehydrogenase [Cryptococcus deuterogattii 99/473]